MEKTKEETTRVPNLMAELYHNEAELERIRKTIKSVNLKKLPDKGEKLKKQEEVLTNLMKSLKIEAIKEIASGDKSKDKQKDYDNGSVKNSGDKKKIIVEDNLPSGSKVKLDDNKTGKVVQNISSRNSNDDFKSKDTAEDKMNHPGFSKVMEKDLITFEKLSKTIPKVTDTLGDLVNSPSFKSYRQPINAAIKLTEAKPMIEKPGNNKYKQTAFNICNPSSLADETVKKLHHSLCTYSSKTTDETPPFYLKTSLMKHQVKALSWLVWREAQQPSGGILADDMGLGKTLTMISLLLKQKENKNFLSTKSEFQTRGTLIVCLASILHQWNEEISKHSVEGSLNVLIYHGPKREKDITLMSRFDVVLTTYEILSSERKSMINKKSDSGLFKLTWERIILDEAHSIKNHSTQKAEAVFSLWGFRRWCVTGTPIHNDFKDMYSLIKFMQFTPFDDYKKWKKLTNDDTYASEERRNLLVKSILLRRTKEEADESGKPLIQMVKKSMSICYLDLSEEEMKVYAKLDTKVKEFLSKYLLKPSMKLKSQHLLTLLLRLQQCCGHISLLGKDEVEDSVSDSLNELSMCLSSLNIENPSESDSESSLDISLSEFQKTDIGDRLVKSTKIKKLFEKLDEISECSDNKDKSVVVSQWVSLLEIVALHLDRGGIPYHMIAGSTKPEDRQKFSDDFNYNARGCKIMLLSLKAGGVGLNLIGGSNLFLLDLHWNPALERQACDRVHRVGQTKEVQIYKFVCNNTIEKKILDLQERKSNLASSVLHGGGKISKGLSMEDFRTLFNVRL